MKLPLLLLAALLCGCEPQTLTVIIHAPTNQTVTVTNSNGWIVIGSGGSSTNYILSPIEKPKPWYYEGHKYFTLYTEKANWLYSQEYWLHQDSSKDNLFRLSTSIFDNKTDATGLAYGSKETFSLYGKGAGEWVLVRVKPGDNLFRVGKVQ